MRISWLFFISVPSIALPTDRMFEILRVTHFLLICRCNCQKIRTFYSPAISVSKFSQTWSSVSVVRVLTMLHVLCCSLCMSTTSSTFGGGLFFSLCPCLEAYSFAGQAVVGHRLFCLSFVCPLVEGHQRITWLLNSFIIFESECRAYPVKANSPLGIQWLTNQPNNQPTN